MSSANPLYASLLDKILRGPAHASPEMRQSAFADERGDGAVATLVATVAQSAHKVTDVQIAAAKGAGIDEDQIFEVVICAAVGAATRQHAAAMAALDAATKE